MIQRVYERAKMAQRADCVIVATDDERIVKAVQEFGGEARMTRTEHRNRHGTGRGSGGARSGRRIRERAGDEPLLDPRAIDVASIPCLKSRQLPQHRGDSDQDSRRIMDPNVVKTVLDFDGNALYFLARCRFPGCGIQRAKFKYGI